MSSPLKFFICKVVVFQPLRFKLANGRVDEDRSRKFVICKSVLSVSCTVRNQSTFREKTFYCLL